MFGFHTRQMISFSPQRNDSYQTSTYETPKHGKREALDCRRQIKYSMSIMAPRATHLNHLSTSNCHASADQQISMTRRCTGIIVCSTGFHSHDWNRLAMGHSCIGCLNSSSMTSGESCRHQFGNLSRRTRIYSVDTP
jgi:hypothetical protein